MKNITLLLILALIGCSTQKSKEDRRTRPENNDLTDLREQVYKLQGTITQINNFVASDFASCDNSLPPFESKICQIAQTANAEQQVLFVGQLQEIAKIFQNELYGTDCLNTTDLGCPVAGSVTARVTEVEDSISDALADIAILQSDVSDLNSDLATINGRLNNFNGSGDSIEDVVSGLEADIISLDNRVDDLEQTVNNGDIYKTFLICGNVAASGPAFEPILITGDNTLAVAYIVTGNSNGMGEVAKAGVTGSQYLSTRSNSATCKFKVYDLTTSIKLCWKNTDRNASSAQIDTACNAPTFAAPLAACTCVN